MNNIMESSTNHLIQNEQYWIDQIKLKQKSGLSRSAYCRLNSLICSKFGYWENKLNPIKQQSSKLVPVKLTSVDIIAKPLEIKCSLSLKKGHEIKVYDQAILPLLITLLS